MDTTPHLATPTARSTVTDPAHAAANETLHRAGENQSDSHEISIRQPVRGDGAAMWKLAKAGGELDLNSSYAYLVMARDFAATCRVAVSGGEVVGYVLGYRPPQRGSHIFVWQIAVRGDQRGRSIASKLLEHLVRTSDGVDGIEATIEESNTASRALFARLARNHGANMTWSEGLTAQDFPDGHNGEPALLITGLDGGLRSAEADG